VSESADVIVVRTDFDERMRMRGRFDWSFTKWLRLLATGELISSSNGSSDVGYDADTDHVALDLEITPVETMTLRLAYDNYDTDSTIPIRAPQDFSIVTSEHSENGQLLEAGFRWQFEPFDIDLGYSDFENTGSFAFDLVRPLLRHRLEGRRHRLQWSPTSTPRTSSLTSTRIASASSARTPLAFNQPS
jgi:hypothetical protein